MRLGEKPPLNNDREAAAADDVNLAAATELFHLLEVTGSHYENEISFGNDFRCQLSRSMSGEIELALHSNQECFIGRRNVVPRVGAGARHVDVGDAAALSDIGVRELVLVEAPPEDPAAAAEWVARLASQWSP